MSQDIAHLHCLVQAGFYSDAVECWVSVRRDLGSILGLVRRIYYGQKSLHALSVTVKKSLHALSVFGISGKVRTCVSKFVLPIPSNDHKPTLNDNII